MKTIFDLCQPRQDVEEGRVRDEDFAADLAKVVRGEAPPEYQDAAVFFRHTHPTKGLRVLLDTVCRRLSGRGGELNSVIRLDTQFGGGKTHGLIALIHAVGGMTGVERPEEFVDPSLLPGSAVRIAALDGENSDPANGVRLEDGLWAKSLWGEMAYRLAGREGYERVRRSDEAHIAPGTDTLVELFGGQPTLILLDEVGVYLRKVAKVFPDRADQFTAFTQSLLKAVTSTPNVCLVFTLAVRTSDKASKDAYRAEQQIAMQAFDEAESVVSRKATQLNPTEEDETVDVLRRRLFDTVDLDAAGSVVESYVETWNRNRDTLPSEAFSPETREQFRHGYPFHPETLNVLVEKTSSLSTFHRTRGMLRLLARTVHHLWRTRPEDALAIHPHHIDPGFEPIRGELTTRLGQGAYAPALAADVASVPGKPPSIAQQLDRDEYAGQPPVTSYLARTAFLHTLAYGEGAQGILPDWLRYSVCSPVIEPAFVEAARKRFLGESLFLDDRPGAPMRFLTEPNLTQMLRKAMAEIDPGEVKSHVGEKIRALFESKSGGFASIPFPAGPYEVPDDVGDGRPYLVVLHYDAFHVSEEPTALPAEIVRMASRKGASEEIRTYRNNLVFVVADQRLVEDMKIAVRRRLALQEMRRAERKGQLADHQQRQVDEWYEGSAAKAAIAVMQCYRHLYYPSPLGRGEDASLGHTSIELQNASDSPGNGQIHVKRALRDQKKLLEAGDAPDAPAYVRDQTPLKTKGQITTRQLRDEFRRAPKLSILLSDDPLIRCVRDGTANETFLYRKGDLVWGKGDPDPSIEISENAFVHTMANALELGLWPRKPKKPEGAPAGRAVTGGIGGTVQERSGSSGGGTGGAAGGGTVSGGTTAPAPGAVSAQGPLRQALIEVFEKARSRKVPALGRLRIRLFEAQAAWALHQGTATYREAETHCTLTLNTLEAAGVERFSLTFAGSLDKANAVKGFLESQMRAADGVDFEAEYRLTFKQGLATTEDAGTALAKAMTKYGGGEAFVEAEAAAPEEAKA